jgi:FAD dependent oxidoreductase
MKKALLCWLLAAVLSACSTQVNTDVLVIGGGTGGTAAGIAAARQGVRTIIVEPTPWLGGMLTAAGVSATDGNHDMPAGIWGEFRQRVYDHYGGPDSVATGWVSNTQFEPHVGAKIFREMAMQEVKLSVWSYSNFISAEKQGKFWKVLIDKNGEKTVVVCRILIDATDLGDVAAAVGCNYDLGMDARSDTGEPMAPEQSNDIVQDLTWCAILKDFGKGADKTIPKPEGYDPEMFRCCCNPSPQPPKGGAERCPGEKPHPCPTMLSYAKLPGNKYLLNWPLHGNDFYAPVAELLENERLALYEKARNKTRCFIYYIQTELGYQHLGFPDDEFPNGDGLALMPYHREGRRIHGLVRLTVNDMLASANRPPSAINRTCIAVGDYPIDHHHKERPDAPVIAFPPVPSFSIPAGCLIPRDVDDLLIADKAISVSNIVNGASRLQPVILQVGQAAGVMAALCVEQDVSPKQLKVREIQAEVLHLKGHLNKGYLMPYCDMLPEHPQFEAIQRVGAAGLLPGKGEPYQWANRTWFYPDSLVKMADLPAGLDTSQYEGLTRAQAAALLDRTVNPFAKGIGFDGK